MSKCNMDIRNEIRDAGLKMYQVAYSFGCNDGNFSRKLRMELSEDQKSKIREIIHLLKGGDIND